jgi:hypothetical protein
MPAHIADPVAPPAPARPHVAAVEAAHRELSLSSDGIAAAVGAHASTLHGWHTGETAPPPACRRRLTALAEVRAAVRGFVSRAGMREAAAAAARPGLDGAGPAVPGLADARRHALLAAGQVERLAALLTAAAGHECPPRGAARAPLDRRVEGRA